MSIPEELIDAIGFSRVFSTLDSRSGYNQLPLLAGNRMKPHFEELIMMGLIMIGSFFPFGLKYEPVEIQRVMDQAFSCL